MIVSNDELKELKSVAEGYKVFNDDWTGYGAYYYGDSNGNIEGTIHKVSGDIKLCTNGFHFCTELLDCMKYYGIIQWNKFAKVKGYGKSDKSKEDSKLAVEYLEIVKELSWEEFIKEIYKNIKSYDGISNGYGISDGRGISNGYGISDGRGISYGYGISNGRGISEGYGISNSFGIYNCYFIDNCNGLSKSIMCIGQSGENYLFNKKTDETRIDEIIYTIKEMMGSWYPKFTNAFDLFDKNNKKWEYVPAFGITVVDKKIAYKDMPEDLIKYFKELPEFDADIFKKITGIEI